MPKADKAENTQREDHGGSEELVRYGRNGKLQISNEEMLTHRQDEDLVQLRAKHGQGRSG